MLAVRGYEMPPAALLLDYALEAVNFVHLSLVVAAFDFVTLGLLLEKAGIAAVEHLDPAVFEQHRFCRHFVEKIAVMAYNYRAAAVVVDEVFEPFEACQVYMVRRLVEQEQIRRAQKQLAQREL